MEHIVDIDSPLAHYKLAFPQDLDAESKVMKLLHNTAIEVLGKWVIDLENIEQEGPHGRGSAENTLHPRSMLVVVECGRVPPHASTAQSYPCDPSLCLWRVRVTVPTICSGVPVGKPQDTDLPLARNQLLAQITGSALYSRYFSLGADHQVTWVPYVFGFSHSPTSLHCAQVYPLALHMFQQKREAAKSGCGKKKNKETTIFFYFFWLRPLLLSLASLGSTFLMYTHLGLLVDRESLHGAPQSAAEQPELELSRCESILTNLPV